VEGWPGDMRKRRSGTTKAKASTGPSVWMAAATARAGRAAHPQGARRRHEGHHLPGDPHHGCPALQPASVQERPQAQQGARQHAHVGVAQGLLQAGQDEGLQRGQLHGRAHAGEGAEEVRARTGALWSLRNVMKKWQEEGCCRLRPKKSPSWRDRRRMARRT